MPLRPVSPALKILRSDLLHSNRNIDSGAKCATNVKQAFRDVVLTDMAEPPDILKSINNSIDGDINKLSQAEDQVADLAEKMQAARKSMKTIEKIHRTMCLKERP